MNQGFLEQEAKQANKRNQKLFIILLLIFIIIITCIGLIVRTSIDINDVTIRKLLYCLTAFAALLLFSIIAGLWTSARSALDASKSLILPFRETSRETAKDIINQEVLEEKVLIDHYTDTFTEEQTPYGERLMLLPSYLLLFNGMGKITAIPRDKIYWLCAQMGRRECSSFIVRLLIFTEKKTFYLEGADVSYFEMIAEQFYQYIPNIFNGYDPYQLSYELVSLFDKDRAQFMKLYENAKQSYEAGI